jgi:hypothetical protein
MVVMQIHKGKNMIELQKLDMITIDGVWYNPLHWLIQWRGLDSAVHNLIVQDDLGYCFSPQLSGIKIEHISAYNNRNITIHRFKNLTPEIWTTLISYYNDNKGYDLRLFFLGGVLGLTCKKWVDTSKQYLCSEMLYWAIQENIKITPKDETLPLPRFFRYNPFFEKIYEGKCDSSLFLD